jgi:branched-chain amino acid transport system permease protein
LSSTLVQIVFSALTLGSVYALMSVGLALVWGGLGVLNLTQGALFMMGAYSAFWITQQGLGPFAGIGAAAAVTFVFGVLLYGLALRPLLWRPESGNEVLIATAAIATILEHLALVQFGPRNRAVPELAGGVNQWFGTPVTWNSIVIMATALAMLVALALMLRWTRFGLAIRAVAQDRDGAQLVGINPTWVFALVFGLSSALAGVGGVLLGTIYFVTPYVGQTYLLTALIVTILGGLGSVPGAMAAAFAVGAIQAVVSFYLGVRWSLPVLFLLIILVLIVRPAGIAGTLQAKRL